MLKCENLPRTNSTIFGAQSNFNCTKTLIPFPWIKGASAENILNLKWLRSKSYKAWKFKKRKGPMKLTVDPCLGCARFAKIASELTKTWSSGDTEFGVWIGNCNGKVWKSTEDKLHKIWNSKYFSQITAKRAHPCDRLFPPTDSDSDTDTDSYTMQNFFYWLRFWFLIFEFSLNRTGFQWIQRIQGNW